MNQTNAIGLDLKKADELAKKLSLLLGNYSVFYQNVRGHHWNIRGERFFELHLKFQELYENLVIKIDDLAERLLTLGYTPTHRYSDYIAISQIKETPNTISDGTEAVKNILDAFKVLIVLQREILALSGDAGDEGTNSLMSDYIKEQEKLVWMYSAFLNASKS